MRHAVSPLGRHVLAAALSLAATSGAQMAWAASPIVASASASISNLQLQVSDFRPDDGIAASAKWVSLGQGTLDVSCCDSTADFPYNARRTLDFSGDKLTNTVSNGISLPGAAAAAFRTPDGAKVSLLIDADRIGSIYSGGKWDPGSVLEAKALYTASGFDLLLDPGAEIRFTGLTTVEASMNLLNSDRIGMLGSETVIGTLYGYTQVQAVPRWDSVGLEVLAQPEGEHAFAKGGEDQLKFAGQIIGGESELPVSQSFVFVIRNNGSQAQSVGFSLNASVIFLGNNENVTAVPEPESVALMVVGLMSLAGLSRRRQRRSKLVKQAAALCLGAALLPMSAQAAPLVTAQATIEGIDEYGQTVGGFDVEPRAEAFYASSGGVAYGPPMPYGPEVRYGASADHDQFGLSLGLVAGAQVGPHGGWPDEPVTSASARLDWSDTIVNTDSQQRWVSLGFAVPQSYWGLDDVASFKLSIWVEGQSSPAWFTGFDRQFDVTQNRSVTVFSGQDIGLRGDDRLSNPAFAREVQLGSLAAGESFKVHFSVDMSAKGGEYGMVFRTSDPMLKLLTSPVPEPSTWALMLAGVAFAGLSARRRQAA